MSPEDLPAVMTIAGVVHPDFPEDEAVFAERLTVYPQGCLVLEADRGIGGYVVSHPWHEGDPPSLNAYLGKLPAPAAHYYLHDLAILPERRGGGAGAAAVAKLLDHAAAGGFDRVRLVAVGGSAPYWARHGFTALAPAGGIASYGADAQVMTRPVAGLNRQR